MLGRTPNVTRAITLLRYNGELSPGDIYPHAYLFHALGFANAQNLSGEAGAANRSAVIEQNFDIVGSYLWVCNTTHFIVCGAFSPVIVDCTVSSKLVREQVVVDISFGNHLLR